MRSRLSADTDRPGTCRQTPCSRRSPCAVWMMGVSVIVRIVVIDKYLSFGASLQKKQSPPPAKMHIRLLLGSEVAFQVEVAKAFPARHRFQKKLRKRPNVKQTKNAPRTATTFRYWYGSTCWRGTTCHARAPRPPMALAARSQPQSHWPPCYTDTRPAAGTQCPRTRTHTPHSTAPMQMHTTNVQMRPPAVTRHEADDDVCRHRADFLVFNSNEREKGKWTNT
jgi:hypothetical protein